MFIFGKSLSMAWPCGLCVAKYEIVRFSIDCRKVIGFALSTPHDWLKKLAPLFHPIKRKIKTNFDSFA